jgi:signal transduction histidine kinase/CheY-like chemotaxis protein
MKSPVHRQPIRSEEEVVAARKIARELAGLAGFDRNDQTRIATAVSEIARNAYTYGGGGMVEFLVESERSAFRVTISDQGQGIPNLSAILAGDYVSETGMGMGILGARRLMDDFRIESDPGGGTRVTLSKRLPEHAPKLTGQRLAKFVSDASKLASQPVLDEMGAGNRDLLRLIDDMRGRQEELDRLNAELEDTNRGVVALYAGLDERANRLRNADEMKSRFLSHMSHEFRTPLTSILALSRLLMDEADGPLVAEQQKQVTYIRKSAENLLELVNDLLDLARVEAGKSVVRPGRFEVESLFGALKGVLKPLHVKGGVQLIFEEPEGIPPLDTDESKVAQILRNLISNALKFTEAGEVRVSAALSPDATSVIFSVADTGIGIAPEHLGLIFQEYRQIETPMQANVHGTGLGLPLSKGLAELLGGKLTVESTFGNGSIFRAEIPIRFRGQGSEAEEPDCDFLLIDDEEVARYLIAQRLGAGARILEASNGDEGVLLAKQHHPRCIVLDVRMPGTGGLEVLRRLKSDADTVGIPVIVMTAKALTDEERDVLTKDARAILSKEILSQPDAGQRIRNALAGRSAYTGREVSRA